MLFRSNRVVTVTTTISTLQIMTCLWVAGMFLGPLAAILSSQGYVDTTTGDGFFNVVSCSLNGMWSGVFFTLVTWFVFIETMSMLNGKVKGP